VLRFVLGTAALLVAVIGLAPMAAAASFSLTDADGVTHFTNAPTDPRYQRMGGMSGTAIGWLRVPEALRSRYGDAIREIADRFGVSARLVEAVIKVESAFNPWAVSRKGAQGLMQLMPATASSLGVRDAFNPRQNIEGGVRHLRYLIDRYAGDLRLALAAYNAGEGAVNAHGGIPPYPETQQYVRKVLDVHGEEAGPAPSVYRYEDADGTVTYTNVPPANRLRFR
jgi:soluble lytic murein transglycosylase-like protein